ncbi:MAG: hypothetical protein IME92_10080 [Proteobacteria bacterium]|nr:hypothetical protein [Pseudomonadota bacterium]
MSDTDSFIEEVTEEVRKDQLYGYFKKYGWMAGALVVLIVGGAIYSEWSSSSAKADAQGRGDAIASALSLPNVAEQVAALEAINTAPGDAAAMLGFQKAAILAEDDRKAAALTALDAIANDDAAKPVYRDMARFKALVLRGTDMDQTERMAGLQSLATPGSAFRPLALEQTAVAMLDANDKDGAIAQLTQLLNEPEISAALRQRAVQLLISMGGEIPALSQLLSGNETAQ